MAKRRWYKNKVEITDEAGRVKETIHEVITGRHGVGFGLAVVDIQRSSAHSHQHTTETYVLVSGRLEVTVLHGPVITPRILDKPGQSLTIEPGHFHFAVSLYPTPARVTVQSIPPWSPEDHIMYKMP